MLQTVDVGIESLDNYRSIIDEEKIEEIRQLARELHGARILHLNAAPYGGGVSELLRSELPILRDLGLHADWKVIFGDEKFFNVTKSFHNALQGEHSSWTTTQRKFILATTSGMLNSLRSNMIMFSFMTLSLWRFYTSKAEAKLNGSGVVISIHRSPIKTSGNS